MTLLVAWLVFPVVLALLALGCALLLEEVGRVRLPGALLLPTGTAAIIVVTQLATAADATAELAVPATAALAVTGLILSPPWRRGRVEPWMAGAAVAVFALYGAPVLLSGEPTFTGYIKLDDTATWLAMTDRMMDSGRSLAGLEPSSYEAALSFYLPLGSPLGAMLPLGTGHALLSTDSAWLFQPCLSYFAAMLALALGDLARPLVRRAPARAAVAVIAAQPALLVGYVMWGGIKEIAAAALIPLIAATVPLAIGAGALTTILPLGIACGALLAVLGPAGGVWIAPPLLAVLVLAVRRLGLDVTARRAIGFGVVVVVLSVPLLTGNAFEAATTGVLYAEDELGNLIEPLNAFQVVGIWPVGDFRFSPAEGTVTALLIAAALATVVFGIFLALRSRAAPLLLLFAGGIVSVLAIAVAGSPWVDAKALATVSPAVLLLAMAGAMAIAERGRRLEGWAVAALIAFGVLWSNVLAYREVNLAPHDQLSELEDIGEEIAGQGPTLMTDYQPYGVRHFLRDADPEGVSELRRRVIPLRGGGEVQKGASADTDQLQLGGLLVYRTLVVRRGPGQSRPPSPYRLLDRGEFYDVWQRPATVAPGLVHMPLGAGIQPTGSTECGRIGRLAATAGSDGFLAYATRQPNVVFGLAGFSHPTSWAVPSDESLYPGSEGSASLSLQLPSADRWRAWLGGSVRGRIELLIDGREIGSARHVFNFGNYIDLGDAELGPGPHLVELRYHGADLHPGSDGSPGSMGPLVFSRSESANEPVRELPASQASELCGRRLDWVEAVPR